MRTRRLAWALWIVLLVGTSAHADDALSPLGPRELSLGGAGRAVASGAMVPVLNPAGGGALGELLLEGGYAFRQGLGAGIYGATCDTSSAIHGCFHYTYVAEGDANGRIHAGGVSLAYPLTPNIYIGQNVKYANVAAHGGAAKEAGFVWDIGLVTRFSSLVAIGAVAKNVVQAKLPNDPIYFGRQFAGGLAVAPSPNVTALFDVLWDDNSDSVRFGGGAEFFWSRGFSQGIPVRAGGYRDQGTESTYVTGGLGYITMKVGLDVGVRYAVDGPAAEADPWEVSVSFRAFAHRPGTSGYSRAAE